MDTFCGFKGGSIFQRQGSVLENRILLCENGEWNMYVFNNNTIGSIINSLSNISLSQVVKYTLDQITLSYGNSCKDTYNFIRVLEEYDDKPKKPIYYKVVRKNDNGLQSVVATTEKVVTYIENKYVYPTLNGTYLFVFDSKENAELAISKYDWSHTNIRECKCQGVEIPNEENSTWCSTNYKKLPKGTLFAYGVKLINNEPLKLFKEGTILKTNTQAVMLVRVSIDEFMLINTSTYNRYTDEKIQERVYEINNTSHSGLLMSDILKINENFTIVKENSVIIN